MDARASCLPVWQNNLVGHLLCACELENTADSELGHCNERRSAALLALTSCLDRAYVRAYPGYISKTDFLCVPLSVGPLRYRSATCQSVGEMQ
jgi:hypothetical protein